MAFEWTSTKTHSTETDLLQDGKIYCLQACACFFEPGNLRDWGSEGVNVPPTPQDHLRMEGKEEDACDDGNKDFFLKEGE